jgi:MoaA/NifB/PqqE/SkfB family radical SAM enzyme
VSSLPSKTFCILPWIHFFHDPTGRIKPCCAATGDFGNIRDFTSSADVVNTPAMQQVRVEMLAGHEPTACAGCYSEESHGIPSFRSAKNQDIEHLNIDVDSLLAKTSTDGHLQDFAMQYWDIRFSNICNLKCRMCGPDYSHTWGPDSVAIYDRAPKTNYVIHAHNEQVDMLRYGNLSQLKEVYFAGGESLFQQEHWELLDRLIELGLTDIRLTYTTNLTKLHFGQRRLEEYLKHFTNVLFIVSVDATEQLGEYIRSGLDWKLLLKNIETIKQFPGVKIKFNCVVTVYNVLYLKDMLEFAYTHGNAFDPIDLTPCHFPLELNITNLKPELKELAELRLLSSRHYIAQQGRIDGIISYMYESPVRSWDRTVQFTNKLDTLRGESVLDVVPEFKQYWK